MARRRGGIENGLLGLLFLIALVGALLENAVNAVGAGNAIAFLCLFIGGIALWKFARHRQRLTYLREKYGDEEVVQRIMRRVMWQGQTAEQLRDAVGNPLAVDNKVMATRKRETWKYRRAGSNRYRLRITLDDDVVIGWDQKN